MMPMERKVYPQDEQMRRETDRVWRALGLNIMPPRLKASARIADLKHLAASRVRRVKAGKRP